MTTLKVFVCDGAWSGTALPATGAHYPGSLDGAMRRLLLADLAELAGIELIGPATPVSFDRLLAAVRAADAVWPLAPARAGLLERLSRQVLRSGRILLGSAPPVLRVTGSRRRSARALARAGIAVAATFAPGQALPKTPGAWVVKPDDGTGCADTRIFANATAALAWIAEQGAPAVVPLPPSKTAPPLDLWPEDPLHSAPKPELRHVAPGRAAPGQTEPGQSELGQAEPGQADPGQADPGQAHPRQIYLRQNSPRQSSPRQTMPPHNRLRQATSPPTDPRQAAAPQSYVLQPYIAGKLGSLSLLCRQGVVTVLACNAERVAVRDDQFHYLGTIVNGMGDADGALARLAQAIGAALPGLWGHVNVDFVKTPAGVVVLAVSTGMTPAYAGLRASLGCNPAALMLDLLAGPMPPLQPGARAVSVDGAALGSDAGSGG